MTELMTRSALALRKNGFQVETFETAQEGADYIFAQVQAGETVGIGGSVTIRETGLGERLRDAGHDVFWHWFTPGDPETLRRALLADVYLASSNAVTSQGQLVNIDGTGNRVAAMIYGPKRVYLLVGRNKLVDGGTPSAIARIKEVACPLNARRLNKQTSCAQTGRCDAANCEKSMCNATAVMTHPTGGHPITVVLVDEEIGY